MAQTKKRTKPYKPKPVRRIPVIQPLILHPSGYSYRKSDEENFIAVLTYFCQALYDAHLRGDEIPPKFPTLPPFISSATNEMVRTAYNIFRSDYLNGVLILEAEIIEE